MPRRAVSPRQIHSRQDRWANHEIITGMPRNKQSQGAAMDNSPYGAGLIVMTLSGTAVTGGVLESEIVTGGETVIMTLANDTWAATLGSNNAITTAFLAAITGDLADAAGWNAQVSLVHGDLVRTSATVMTLTLPATAGYSITTGNETVTIAPPASAVDGAQEIPSATFVITEGS